MKLKLEITFSKIIAVVIIIIGFILTLILKDTSVILMAIPAATALIGSKQYNDRKKIEKSNGDYTVSKD